MSIMYREWFDRLLETAFDDHSTELFIEDKTSKGALKINPQPSNTTDNLELFRFLGRIHSMAMLHGFLIDPKLVPLFSPLLKLQPDEINAEKFIADATKRSITTW